MVRYTGRQPLTNFAAEPARIEKIRPIFFRARQAAAAIGRRLRGELLQFMTEINRLEIQFASVCNDACGGWGASQMWLPLTYSAWAVAGKTLHMNRLCLVGLGLLCSVAATKAESPKPARAHPVKAIAVKSGPSKKGGLSGVKFSDPYAPPVGTQKAAIALFPTVPTEAPIDPQGGFSLTAGRDSPDAPFTGGVKFRF